MCPSSTQTPKTTRRAVNKVDPKKGWEETLFEHSVSQTDAVKAQWLKNSNKENKRLSGAVAFLFLVTRLEGTRLLVSARVYAPLHSQSRCSHLEACF